MPTYTLLGATGAAGSAVLGHLLKAPPIDLKLYILVRSKKKLIAKFPGLQETVGVDVTIIQGDSTDALTLRKCLANVDAVFMCVGQNESSPGVSLIHDTVSAVVNSLKTLSLLQGAAYRAPTVLQLRSASLNPKLSCQVPRLVYNTVSFCLHYNHLDMVRASHLYESAASDGILGFIYVDPPTIHDALGTQSTGYALILSEKQSVTLSYADLGSSFCELAQRRNEFLNQAVGVTATGRVNTNWTVLAGYLLGGAKERFAVIKTERPRLSTAVTMSFYIVLIACLFLLIQAYVARK